MHITFDNYSFISSLKSTIMRKLLLSFFATACCIIASAQNTPNIILKAPAGNKPIMMGIATGEQVDKIMIDWGDGKMEPAGPFEKYDGFKRVPVSGFPKGTGEVKIYGDKIIIFDCGYVKSIPLPGGETEAAKITELNVSNLPTLQELFAASNKLTKLDLSKNTELITLDVQNNILKDIDVSANTKLKKLTLTNNKLSSIDLSKNKELTTIYLTKNTLGSVDFSACNKLKNIYALDCGLTGVKFGNNNTPKITLSLNNNKLSTLDLSTLTGLDALYVNNNALTNIKFNETGKVLVSKIKRLYVMNNRFTFATLPVPGPTAKFSYAPQQPVEVEKTYTVGSKIDLSAQDNIQGILSAPVSTQYVLCNAKGDELASGTDYTVTEGQITLLSPQENPVYVKMSTKALPMFSNLKALKTTSFTVSRDNGVAGIDKDATRVSAGNGTLYVKAANGRDVTIFDITGKTIMNRRSNGIEATLRLPAGLYLVKVGNKTFKIRL